MIVDRVGRVKLLRELVLIHKAIDDKLTRVSDRVHRLHVGAGG